MEIILLLIVAATALTNLAATIYYGKQLTGREEYRIEFIPVPADFLESASTAEPEPEQQKEIPQPAPQPAVAPKNDSHSAWVNRKGIPASELYRTPEPPIKAKENGPLGRPDGFV